MNWRSEGKILLLFITVFLVCFYLPAGHPRFDGAVLEAFHLIQWYAREHVILCLIPAFFIAGAIAVFVSQGAVMRYLGPSANKALAYGVASVSGTALAVCSCTVLPLFAGIYRMGAGLGPASAFLYSGPAINALAIILTANVLGFELGVARAVGAIVFSVVIGLSMHAIFRNEESEKERQAMVAPSGEGRPLRQNAAFFGAMIAILIFANWAKPDTETGIGYAIYTWKWPLTAFFSAALALLLTTWFGVKPLRLGAVTMPIVALALLFPAYPVLAFLAGVIGLSFLTAPQEGELGEWFSNSWDFAKQIMPLLFIGVFAAGLLLGRPGEEGLIPSQWVSAAVGGNSLAANFFAAIVGAFMYFATLTEIPILQGLIGSGMGKGPALSLLLAGPALSLPNMLVIRGIMGTKKTAVYVALVVVMSTLCGWLFGNLFS